MLQRSPSYVLAQPAVDFFAQWAQNYLPNWLAYRINTVKVASPDFLFVKFCTLYPLTAQKIIEKPTVKQLLDRAPYYSHFSPRYNQREEGSVSALTAIYSKQCAQTKHP